MKVKFLALFVLCTLATSQTFAASYTKPPEDESLVGRLRFGVIQASDKPAVYAKQFDVGMNALQSANPHVNLMGDKFPSGEGLQIPTQHLLPSTREGIVVNLPEMRMYYYPEGTNKVLTYPIGIGKVGKTIPIVKAAITRKVKNPIWFPPDDIREFNITQGIVLPKIMLHRPDNPLGPYAIYMSVPTYLIHSTIFPESIGKRASFGCIRMYESDIETFFPSITGGIPVEIVNAPVKLGWQKDRLYIEAHKPLEEHMNEEGASLPSMVQMLQAHAKDQPTLIDWQLAAYIDKYRDGVPHEVGMKMTS